MDNHLFQIQTRLDSYANIVTSSIKESLNRDEIGAIWGQLHFIEQRLDTKDPKAEVVSWSKIAFDIILPIMISEGLEMLIKKSLVANATENMINRGFEKKIYAEGLVATNPIVIKHFPQPDFIQKNGIWVRNTFEFSDKIISAIPKEYQKIKVEIGDVLHKNIANIESEELSLFQETAADAIGATIGSLYSYARELNSSIGISVESIDDSLANHGDGPTTLSSIKENKYKEIYKLYDTVFESIELIKVKFYEFIRKCQGVPIVVLTINTLLEFLVSTNKPPLTKFFNELTKKFLTLYKRNIMLLGDVIYSPTKDLIEKYKNLVVNELGSVFLINEFQWKEIMNTFSAIRSMSGPQNLLEKLDLLIDFIRKRHIGTPLDTDSFIRFSIVKDSSGTLWFTINQSIMFTASHKSGMPIAFYKTFFLLYKVNDTDDATIKKMIDELLLQNRPPISDRWPDGWEEIPSTSMLMLSGPFADELVNCPTYYDLRIHSSDSFFNYFEEK